MAEKETLPDEKMAAVTGGAVNPPDQFSDLPIRELIGGPLQAAAEAQQTLAKLTQDFIAQMELGDAGAGKKV